MTTVLDPPEPQQAPGVQIPGVQIDGRRLYDIVGQLCDVAEARRTRSEYFRCCFDIICRHFCAEVGTLNLRLGPRTLEQSYSNNDSPDSEWVNVADSLVLRAQTDETALVKLYRSRSGTAAAYALAAPVLSAQGRPFGAVSLVVYKGEFSETQSQLVLLTQLLELVVANTPPTPAPQSGANGNRVLQSVVRASDYRSIHQLAFAIVNSLCDKFGCEQIAIGLVRHRDVRVLAVSGMDEVPRNTPGITAVQQAMSVCLDRNEVTVVQENRKVADQVDSSPCRVHHHWHQVTGESAVVTIPLAVDGQCVAVIAMRRAASQPFVREDIDRARIVAESFAPALPLVDRASRSLARHLVEASIAGVGRLCSWKGIGRKSAALAFLLFLSWCLVGKVNYHVLAPCKIVPQEINTVAAPFDGRIAEVLIVPGQEVRRGQAILRMDVRDLYIERKRILTEIAAARIEANNLLQNRHAADAFLLQAQIRVLETDLELVEKHIERAEVRAQADGVILPTEIHRRIGQFVAMGEPLIEVADQEKWHLEIETPESDARHLLIDQQGSFQTYARPDQTYDCRVAKINPSTQVIDKRNVVVAEAVLMNRDDWMKVGMEGNVRIKTSRKPVWWVYGHPVIDYLRMNLWL